MSGEPVHCRPRRVGADFNVELARELERAGWPEVAADAERGVPPEVLLRRLLEIGEGESEAARVIADASGAA